MMVRKALVGLLLILTVVLAACGGTAQAPDAPANGDQNAGATETPMLEATSDDMMAEETPMPEPTAGDVMAEETPMAEAKAGDAMAEETPMAGPTAGDVMPAPAWFDAELADVNTGRLFRLADFQGKVVLVEMMAIWCPNCLAQQREVQALRAALGPRDDLAMVVLDVDSNEDAASLRAYTAQHGFDWTYAVAPPEVAREIGQLYGDQFLNPTARPMLIVDRHGEVHPLPFGAKSDQDLQSALEPFLSETM